MKTSHEVFSPFVVALQDVHRAIPISACGDADAPLFPFSMMPFPGTAYGDVSIGNAQPALEGVPMVVCDITCRG